MEIKVPQGRKSTFELQVAKKRQKDISDVADKILTQIEDWQKRPLDDVYPILCIDAIHYSVRDNGVIRKLAAYVILGINTEGKADEIKALAALDHVTEKWTPKYPNSMKHWKDNWDAISPIFKFSATVRKVIYTTNAIESLNSTYRKLYRQRSVFPSDTVFISGYIRGNEKWTTTIRNWGQVYGKLSIMYEGRLPE